MKTITLSNGAYVTVVDDIDFDELSRHKWHASPRGDGRCYAQRAIFVDGRWSTILMHRQIMNSPKGKMVDHENHNTLDNRRQNLRIANNRQNQWNQRKHQDSKSKYRGICWHKDYKKWMARISSPEGRITIGFFDSEEAGAQAYDAYAKQIYGEFAHLNFTIRS
jgi:hypothetical protein